LDLTKSQDGKLAGALVFVGCAQFTVSLIVAESFYAGYSISQNYISDLGATCRTTCQVIQPTATIFNASIILLGLMIIAGAYFLRRSQRPLNLSILLALTGIGAVGVGVFPETAGSIHSIFSLITFVSAALTTIASSKVVARPLSYLSVVLGIISLAALAMYVSDIFLGLGPGGMERMIVYPVLVWGIAFGAYLQGT